MRLILRVGALLTLVVLLTTIGFAKSPAKSKAKRSHDKTADTSSSTSNSADTKADEPVTSAETAPAHPHPPPQKSVDRIKTRTGTINPLRNLHPCWPRLEPLVYLPSRPADTLPKGGFGFSAYGNKFGRMPEAQQFFNLAWM